ncbi:unnamed protein product [Toxocara canis]|uniref:Uncharacterized protein n=1 Tax=Toxocara canis TaxID=6265 RepID=A0A183UIL9_TOXCA|nr:unnamed protein product [Toxocara canis]
MLKFVSNFPFQGHIEASTTVFAATVIVFFHPVVVTNSTRVFGVECENLEEVRPSALK